jgi:ribosome-binding factor A
VRADRKTLQLCHQVAEELQLILVSECEDEALWDLQIESVVPAPNSSRLLVSVSSPHCTTPNEVADMLTRLQHAMGILRSEVAMSIHRRKAPELLFRVVRPGTGMGEVPE